MDERKEFVRLARMPGANVSELCRRFAIHRSNGYKWLARYVAEGEAGLIERSRRPHGSPHRTPMAMEAAVLAVRASSNGAWGGSKISHVLKRRGEVAVPSASTITEILRRHGKLDGPRAGEPRAFVRFERAAPNELWQMDFKGHFAAGTQRCHPLGALDDHSRYAVGMEACADECDATVRERLTRIFRRYGLPWTMLMDNGPPWGEAAEQPRTGLTVWLLRLGIGVIHGRPRHPQTQGKEERLHRTLKAEIALTRLRDLADCQRAFDRWRAVYNHERPHHSLAMAVPASRYQPSTRSFPETLPPIEYDEGEIVRRVGKDGRIEYRGRRWRVGKPFRGHDVALRPTRQDGELTVHFGAWRIATLNLRDGTATACGFVDDAGASPTTPQALPPL